MRRPAGDPKYAQPAGGSGVALYGADGVNEDLPVVLVEGEFDALAVAQEASDLVVAVATGSTHGTRHLRWLRLLQAVPVVLVAFDGDEARRGWRPAGGSTGCPVPGAWCPRATRPGCSGTALTCACGCRRSCRYIFPTDADDPGYNRREHGRERWLATVELVTEPLTTTCGADLEVDALEGPPSHAARVGVIGWTGVRADIRHCARIWPDPLREGLFVVACARCGGWKDCRRDGGPGGVVLG